MKQSRSNRASIALITLIIISAFLMIIASTISRNNFLNRRSQTMENQAKLSRNFSSACAEEALYRLKTDANFQAGSLNLNGQICTISISGPDNNKSIQVSVNSSKITKNLLLNARITETDSDRSISLTSWQEQ